MAYMTSSPIPVRIPREWLPRLDAAAKRLGTNRARLIAFCAQTFAENFEKMGVAMMPPNWPEIFASMDGRRKPDIFSRYPAHRPSDWSVNERPNSARPAKAVDSSDIAEEIALRSIRRARRPKPGQ